MSIERCALKSNVNEILITCFFVRQFHKKAIKVIKLNNRITVMQVLMFLNLITIISAECICMKL